MVAAAPNKLAEPSAVKHGGLVVSELAVAENERENASHCFHVVYLLLILRSYMRPRCFIIKVSRTAVVGCFVIVPCNFHPNQ